MSINWIAVARDVSIVFGLVLVSSFAAVQIVQGMGEEATPLVIGLSNIFWGTVGFTISGCLAKTQRFKHLFTVAIGLWLVSFVNVAMGLTQLPVWAAGFLLILVMMGLGGGLSFLFVSTPLKDVYVCTVCGTSGVPLLITKGSLIIEIILWLFMLVPGLIYSVWRLTTRCKACPACQSPSIVPDSSPIGQQMLTSRKEIAGAS